MHRCQCRESQCRESLGRESLGRAFPKHSQYQGRAVINPDNKTTLGRCRIKRGGTVQGGFKPLQRRAHGTGQAFGIGRKVMPFGMRTNSSS